MCGRDEHFLAELSRDHAVTEEQQDEKDNLSLSQLLYAKPTAHMVIMLTAYVYFIVSMTTFNKNSLRHFSLSLLYHLSNLQTIQYMEVKLGAHVYFCVSINKKGLRHFSLQANKKSYELSKQDRDHITHGVCSHW